jgi:heterodisulfide reductase subunit A
VNRTKAKIGVYVCHCGKNIADTVDIKSVTAYAKTLFGVVLIRDYEFMCSKMGQDIIHEDILNKNLNRVVVASCSPLMHEQTFRNTCEDAGINPFFFQMANIREQCAWAINDRNEATKKAKSLINATIRRVRHHEPISKKIVDIHPSTLVIGAGIAGIEAALKIANAGKQVYLLEREPSIGGHMAQIYKTFPTLDCAA